MVNRIHYLMQGCSTPTRPIQVLPLAEPRVRLQKARTGQEVRVRRENQECRTWCFHALVLSTTGGMGREAETLYKCLVDMIANKRQKISRDHRLATRCRMSFASKRSSIMFIRGSRSSIHRHIFGDSNISMATSEARTLGLVNNSIEDIRRPTEINQSVLKQLINIFIKKLM